MKPARPVPASRIFEVDERVGARRRRPRGARRGERTRGGRGLIAEMDVEAVGVCLLHAFANPAHERRVAEILREELPGIAVTTSVDVLPVVREYERSLATVLNATGHARRVDLCRRGSRSGSRTRPSSAPLLLMQSNGGVAGAAAIRQAPGADGAVRPCRRRRRRARGGRGLRHRATSSPSTSAAPAPTSA